MIRKFFHQFWVFECPDAIMTSSILHCKNNSYLVFGGHDRTLYLMDHDLMILDDIIFDGWARCSYTIDLDGDGCEEILVGTGDGRLFILRIDEKKKKLIAILNYKTSGMINCCVAGDFYHDGEISLIFGGEDKTLKILKNQDSQDPSVIFYYDSWVTACDLGYFRFPKATSPTCCIAVGTKNGLLQLIQIKNNKPDIIWQKQIYGQINDIKIADVKNDGYNEIVVACDDTYVKIYDSEGNRVSYIKIKGIQTKNTKKGQKRLNRPKSLLIEDIDGDNSKELIVGSADGILRVYHIIKKDSNDFKLKWKTSTSSGSIRGICTYIDKDDEQKLRHIIFGGYGRTLRNVVDFEWGKKPAVKIPQRFKIPKIQIKKPLDKKKFDVIKPIHTNLRSLIKYLLDNHGFYLTLELLINELMQKGYEKKEIVEELEFLKSKGAMKFDKIDVNVWILVSDEIDRLIEGDSENSESKKKSSSKSNGKN